MSFQRLGNNLEIILFITKDNKTGATSDLIMHLFKEKTNRMLFGFELNENLSYLVKEEYLLFKNDKYYTTPKADAYLANLYDDIEKKEQDKKNIETAQEANNIAKKSLKGSYIANTISFVALVIAAIALFKK